MRASVSMVDGCGWHVGRPLWVPFVVALGIPVGFVLQLVEMGVALATHHIWGIGWLAPLFALWMAHGRLSRIRARGFQLFDRPFQLHFRHVEVVRPAENPRLWRLLYRLEVLIWVCVVASWSIVPVTAVVEARRLRPHRTAPVITAERTAPR